MIPSTIADLIITGLVLGYGQKIGSKVDSVEDMTKSIIDNLPALVETSQELQVRLQDKLTALRYRPRLYEKLTIDLSTARSKEKHDITGTYLIAQSIDGTLEVRFNEKDADPVTVNGDNRIFEVNFDTLYLTNSAQSGKSVTFLIGKGHAFAGSSITPMTFNAQDVGVYLQPEWAVLQEQDKNFNYYGTNKASGYYASGAYQVPSGKTLFITSIQTYIRAYNAADRDLAQHFLAETYTDSGNFKVQFGGDGGAVLDFTRSLRVDAGDYVNFYVYNYANHNCNIGISAQGYEM